MIEKLSPRKLKFFLNLYGPYLGAGVKIEHISDDFSEIHVTLKLRWYNKNAVGTHFGGSLYSMVDPHLMLMMMKQLGNEYIVWDKSASIDFLRPGKGKVTAVVAITTETTRSIREQVDTKGKHTPEFTIKVVDEKQKLVARIRKTLYVRWKLSL